MIRAIEKNPMVLVNWKIAQLKKENSMLAQQIKEMIEEWEQ